MRSKPLLRVRKTGALLVAAVIGFVGAVPFAGAGWEWSWVLLIPAAFFVWAWRAGTDVYADELRVRALVGSTRIPWQRIAELAPDQRGQVSALLDNGNVIKLTGVTRVNLPEVMAVAEQDVDRAVAQQEADRAVAQQDVDRAVAQQDVDRAVAEREADRPE